MSDEPNNFLTVIGALLILFGMFRLIYVNHRSPHNVSLTSWMLTGGLIELVAGLLKGTLNLLRLYLDANAIGAFCVYLGTLIFVLAL